MNNITKIAVGLALALLVSLGVSYAIRAIRTERAVASLDNKGSKQVMTYEAAHREMIGGCMEEDFTTSEFNQRQYCQCVADGLLADYTPNQVIKMGLSSEGSMDSLLTPYVNKCLAQQGFYN